MSEHPGDLRQQVEEFGRETAGLLSATLPDLPEPPIEILSHDARHVIRPPSGNLPLYIQGDELARLELSVACELDSVGRYLAVHRSTFGLVASLDRTPVLRMDYAATCTPLRRLTSRFMRTVVHCRTYFHRLVTQPPMTCPHSTFRLEAPGSDRA